MNTTETTLLIILTTLLSIFLIVLISVSVVALKLIKSVQQVVTKAEGVVDSVEHAADIFKDASGKMAMIKVIKNIVDLVQNKKRR